MKTNFLTDNEKIRLIIKEWFKYNPHNKNTFINKIKITEVTLNNWRLGRVKKIRISNKIKICKNFKLNQIIWNQIELYKFKKELEKGSFNKNIIKNNSKNKYLGEWFGYSYKNPEAYTKNENEIWRSSLVIKNNQKRKYFIEFNYWANRDIKYKGKLKKNKHQINFYLKGIHHKEKIVLMFNLAIVPFPEEIVGIYLGLTFNCNLPIAGRILLSRKKLKDEEVKDKLGKKEVITIRSEHINKCSPK